MGLFSLSTEVLRRPLSRQNFCCKDLLRWPHFTPTLAIRQGGGSRQDWRSQGPREVSPPRAFLSRRYSGAAW